MKILDFAEIETFVSEGKNLLWIKLSSYILFINKCSAKSQTVWKGRTESNGSYIDCHATQELFFLIKN